MEEEKALTEQFDENKSCYSCRSFSLCFLRRGVKVLMRPPLDFDMFVGGMRAWQWVFVVLAHCCTAYVKVEEE